MSPKLKIKIKSVVVLLLFVLIPIYSLGASLSLNRIGSLDLDGKTYSEWWYTGSKPTFYGTAVESSSVTVSVDGTEATTTADASGNWTYYLNKDPGDYAIVITQGSESYSFTLHLGQSLPNGSVESTEATSSVPETGIDQYMALMLGVGIVLLATYFYISGDSNRKAVFETRVLKED
ncbi:hypothetical protein ACFL15_01100 [Patescibacteria group bacterium]